MHIIQREADVQSSREQEASKGQNQAENPPRLDFKFLNTGSASAGRKRGESRTQRCGAVRLWDLRPGAVLSRAGRLGALQTVRCATPASSYGRPGAAAPSCAALAPTSAPVRPGPPAQTNLPAGDANEVDRGPQGHPLAPCRTRTHSHLHLRTESLRGLRLPGWPRAVPARARRRSGDLDPTGSDRAEKEENRTESGGRIPGAFECRAAASPPRPRCHFPLLLPCGFHTPPSPLTEF